jgi:hypothetical protein
MISTVVMIEAGPRLYGMRLDALTAHGGHQTPHDPPYPTVTLSPSTMTGTCRLPPESPSISSSFARSALTSM